MKCKREFPIEKVEAQKEFASSLKTLQKKLANINPIEHPLDSHRMHQAIFALPNVTAFGDEEHMGNLHFNDHFNLKALAHQADDAHNQSIEYLKQALQQLDMASDCYERSRQMTATKKEQYQTNINVCKSHIQEHLEKKQSATQDNPTPVHTKRKASATFYAVSVPPKKKEKFERDELSAIKPQYQTLPQRSLSFFQEKSHVQQLIETYVSSTFKNDSF